MRPVIRAIAARGGIEQRVLLTGQHHRLIEMFPGEEARLVRELRYDPSGRDAHELRDSLHRTLAEALAEERPDLVLVHGDTTSALAAACAAADRAIPVAHVEAGLRSFDFAQPWPEEGNRVAIDALSSLLFAPTAAAAENLRRDQRVSGRIVVTGNTGIDALFAARQAGAEDGTNTAAPPPRTRTILVTCHRRENRGAPLRAICAALRQLVREHPLDIVLPLHPNRHVRAEVEALLAGEPRIALVEPLDHVGMVRLMERCWLILTDSGGLQEEAPALGKPVFVLRDVTERRESIEGDTAALIGTDHRRIVSAVAGLLADPDAYARMSRPALPFGDGRAGPRIAAALEAWLRLSPPASAGRSADPGPRAHPPAVR